MGRSASRLVLFCLAIGCAFAVLTAAAGAAEVTIGADVSQATNESGTCGYLSAGERPCVFVDNVIYGGPFSLVSPCDGTVTRFRLNGIPRPANHYALRVVHRNGDGTYTGTATSAPVQIATEGVNEYSTNLPIKAGETLGIDFLDSTEEHGLRWVGSIGASSAVLFEFPADGTAKAASISSTSFYYLFNADIACSASVPQPPPVATPSPSPTPAPTPTPPSNAFRVVGLQKSTLSVSLASPGVLTATEAPAKGKKTAPRLLKPSSATGGPGTARLKLALTGAAKAMLRETGKVRVRTTLAFTPTGGSTAVQVRTLTVKKGGKRKAHSSAAALMAASRAPTLTRKKAPRPDCRSLLPITKVEEVMGGEVTLEHFGPSDFIRNADTPGTEDGTECIYATTEATRNDYGIAGTVSTAFAETPKEWNGYRASAKAVPALENTTFAPVKLGGGTKAFVLHEGLAQADEPDIYYLYVYTPLQNMFSIHFLSGVTLATEEGLAKELAPKLDAEWRASK